MTIKVGDHIPDGTLTEFIEVETAGCSLGPNKFNVQDLVKGKKIALFAVPGAFTPTCSAKTAPATMTTTFCSPRRSRAKRVCAAVRAPRKQLPHA